MPSTMHSPELARFASVIDRLERRVRVQRERVRAAREKHASRVLECDAAHDEARRCVDALAALYDMPGKMDRPRLYGVLGAAGRLRVQWREALARAHMLEEDAENARSEAASAAAMLMSMQARIERLEGWLNRMQRRERHMAMRRAQDQSEDQVWMACVK